MRPQPPTLSPGAQAVVKPGQTPCEQSKALNGEGLSHDAVKSLAHGLPEKDSIKWASASAEKVADPANVADYKAVQAAKAYCQNPTPDAQKAAALAASKTDFQGPGAWAAQSAAWAGSPGGMSAQAVTGAVLLSAIQAGKNAPPVPPPIPTQPAVPALNAPGAKPGALPTAPMPPAIPQPPVPEVPVLGADGLTMTPAERKELSKNCDPFLQMGCDIGSGRA